MVKTGFAKHASRASADRRGPHAEGTSPASVPVDGGSVGAPSPSVIDPSLDARLPAASELDSAAVKGSPPQPQHTPKHTPKRLYSQPKADRIACLHGLRLQFLPQPQDLGL